MPAEKIDQRDHPDDHHADYDQRPEQAHTLIVV
jgi:hypothetical protein